MPTPTTPFYPMTHDDAVEMNQNLLAIKDAMTTPKQGIVYGFHWNGDEGDPYEAITYVADAVGMTPAHMDYANGQFVYGSWKDAFFMPRPCMLKYDGTVDYYLDPNDYTKKYQGGDSDVASDSYGGNAMMEWGQNGKKIWYKIVPDHDATSATVYIADHQADQDFHCWSFINGVGGMVDHFYTPIYNGWSDGSSRMRSISGKAPTASLDATTERTRCRNNHSSSIWDTEVFADVVLINLLLVLVSKSLDSQTAFGQGCTSPGQAGVLNTGTGNALGMFFGYTDTDKVVKVFGMENWWGNLWRRFGGCVNVLGTMKYKLTRGRQDGSSSADYVISATASDYNGYLQGGALPAASGTYVKKMLFNRDIYTPYEMSDGADSAHYTCDGLWTNNSQVNYACRGGCADVGAPCGAWCLLLNASASGSHWAIAAAPSCKPL